MIVRERCITVGVPLAIAVGVALTWAQPALAARDSTAPAVGHGEYAVHAVCGAPAPRQARCMALQLVPRAPQAGSSSEPGPAQVPAPADATAGSEPAAASPSPAAGEFGLRPQDLHSAYQLPTSAPDSQTIAVVDAYNDPTAEADLATYDAEFKLPACTAADGCFEQVGQNGEAGDLPFPKSVSELELASKEGRRGEANAAIGWSLEISLDLDTAHAVCQSCHIVLVEGNTPSYTNLEIAEDSAARLGASEISNSWGGPECVVAGECNNSAAFDHPGIVITAAAGDEGYLNWLEGSGPSYANFPATSPQVVAVGGTRLTLGRHGEWSGETVWNDGGEREGVKEGEGATGGGCSVAFKAPAWQRALPDWAAVGCGEGRAVSDISADADPYSGVAVYDSIKECPYLQGEAIRTSHWCQVGGTSLATPLIAATFALAGGADGVEFPAQTLYENNASSTGVLHDVTDGSNGECRAPFEVETGESGCTAKEEGKASCSSHAICLAGSGYDGPTGLGTPDGTAAFIPARAPTVTTGGASSVTDVSATLNASVNPGGREVSACRFEYGPSIPYESSAPCSVLPGSGRSAVAVSAAIGGLTPSTTYHFRVLATNSVGTADGEDGTFKTFAPGTPPAVEGESAVDVTQGSATLEAQIDPEGMEAEYELVVEDPCAPPKECIQDVVVAKASLAAATSAESVSVKLAGSGTGVTVEPDTSYGFWVIARNGAGVTEGTHETFTTPAASANVTQLSTTLGQQGPGQEPPASQGPTTSAGQAVAGLQERAGAPVPDAELASRSLTANRSGVLEVRVDCPATEVRCTGRVTLRTLGAVVGAGSGAHETSSKATLTLAASPFTVAGGHVAIVRLRLSRAGLALLAAAHTLHARATIFARDPAGTTHTAQVLVTIRAARVTPAPKS
jgi:Subtilase family